MKKTFLSSLCLLALIAGAARGFNHPEIKWQSVKTKHFIINYYDKTEPAVYATWKIAEQAYEVLAQLFEYETDKKISISLAEYDDYSNGWASWLDRSIMIWVPDSRFDLRADNTWLRNVIIHELTHIITLEKRKGIQVLDWTFDVNALYLNRNAAVSLGYREPLPRMSFYPAWYSEGVAQWGSELMGGDCWDSRRDMILRCATLDRTLLSYREMGHFNHNSLGDEMVYNQGYSFTKFIENSIGRDKYVQIWKDGARERIKLEYHFRYRTGKTLQALYGEWKKKLEQDYRAMVPPDPTNTTAIWNKGFFNFQPKESPDGRFRGWLTNHKDDGYRTDLVIIESGSGRIAARIKHAHTSWDFSADGAAVYYIKSRDPDADGSFLNDIFTFDLGAGRERRLTRGARVYDIASSPDNKSLLVTRYDRGTFSLARLSLASLAFAPVIDGEAGKPFAAPHVCPGDPDRAVVTMLVDGKPDIYLVNINEKSLTPLVAHPGREETPFWAGDGRIYFSADYDGIYNIYSILPDGSDLARHTSIVGGAFSPRLTRDGGLLFSEYSSGGFSIASCTPAAIPYTAPQTHACSYRELDKPKGTVRIKSEPYRPKLLRPFGELTAFADVIIADSSGRSPAAGGLVGADFYLYRSDALEKRMFLMEMALLLLVDTDAIYSDYATATPADAVRGEPLVLNHETLPDMARENPRARLPLMLQKDRQPLSAYSGALVNDALRKSAQSNEPEDSTETASTVSMILFPSVYYESNSHRPSLGLYADAYLLMILPMYITLAPYIYWHPARDWYWGIFTQVMVAPMSLSAAGGLSLWAEWFSYTYYNQDYRYNFRNMTSFQASLTPTFEPAMHIDTDYHDTTSAYEGRIALDIRFSHGFPLFPYASLILDLACRYSMSGDTIEDEYDAMEQYSSQYVNARPSLSFVFPVVRNINRGALYADNLYGRLFYSFSFQGNEEFLASLKPFDTPNTIMAHTAGVGLDLGFTKRYMFDRMLSLRFAVQVNEHFREPLYYGSLNFR